MKLKFPFVTACAAVLISAGSASAAIPANGQYQIVNRATGMAIDNYSLTTWGDPVRQYTQLMHLPQAWTVSTTGGYWKFQCGFTGNLCLDTIGRTGNGSVCGQWPAGSGYNQQWTIQDLGTGYYRIVNRANGLALDTGGLTAIGSDVQMWGVGYSYNQQWEFLPAGAVFYSERAWTGTKSQRFTVGDYSMAQMVAKGCANDSVDSCEVWPGLAAICYNEDSFGGGSKVFTQRDWVMAGVAGGMSSVKVQNGLPAGHVMKEDSYNLSEFQPGYLFGTWIAMHRGDWVRLVSNGTARYTCRYETEYWRASGFVTGPSIVVDSGTNVLVSTNGTSELGTCTGTALPWEAYYDLNGKVTWTNQEAGCSVNFALRDGQ